MRRDLERRLQTLETSWFGSPKIAAHRRKVSAMSDEELIDAILKAAEADEGFAKFLDAEMEKDLGGR